MATVYADTLSGLSVPGSRVPPPPLSAMPPIASVPCARNAQPSLSARASPSCKSTFDTRRLGATPKTCSAQRASSLTRQCCRHVSFPQVSDPSAACKHATHRPLKTFSAVVPPIARRCAQRPACTQIARCCVFLASDVAIERCCDRPTLQTLHGGLLWAAPATLHQRRNIEDASIALIPTSSREIAHLQSKKKKKNVVAVVLMRMKPLCKSNFIICCC